MNQANNLADHVRQTKNSQLLLTVLILLSGIYGSVLAQQQPSGAAELSLSVTVLYFDQSRDQLRPGVKVALDSIAQLLVKQPKLLATVTGYSDTIGHQKLNLALAESRAKSVESYLKQRGVEAEQIMVNWEGPDAKPSKAYSEDSKRIRRRVVVLLSPR